MSDKPTLRIIGDPDAILAPPGADRDFITDALRENMERRFEMARQVGFLTGTIREACAELEAGRDPKIVAAVMRDMLAEVEG